MCLAQRPQRSEAPTRDPSISSEALYHWATALPATTVKPVKNGHSKIDKTKVLMTTGSLMKVESIAECCNTFDLH